MVLLPNPFHFFVGNVSPFNMSLEHQRNPQQDSIFPAEFFQNPMLQPHLFGFNNMEGEGGHGPHGFFFIRALRSTLGCSY